LNTTYLIDTIKHYKDQAYVCAYSVIKVDISLMMNIISHSLAELEE